jgi:hypothetical protein
MGKNEKTTGKAWFPVNMSLKKNLRNYADLMVRNAHGPRQEAMI